MTTYFRQQVSCANCGRPSEHDAAGSTNASGSSDLDLRPPEMQRSTMHTWLQVCPHCGYIAPSLSSTTGDTTKVSGPEYRQVMDDQHYPELARRFLAYALLTVSADPASAALARLSAAWVCDDSGLTELAIECRCRAADCFLKLKPFEESEKAMSQGAVLVDVLRRAGKFERAAIECNALLTSPKAAGILRQVLEYQRRLIGDRDATIHRVEECTS